MLTKVITRCLEFIYKIRDKLNQDSPELDYIEEVFKGELQANKTKGVHKFILKKVDEKKRSDKLNRWRKF